MVSLSKQHRSVAEQERQSQSAQLYPQQERRRTCLKVPILMQLALRRQQMLQSREQQLWLAEERTAEWDSQQRHQRLMRHWLAERTLESPRMQAPLLRQEHPQRSQQAEKQPVLLAMQEKHPSLQLAMQQPSWTTLGQARHLT
jgi:hypothetical protein